MVIVRSPQRPALGSVIACLAACIAAVPAARAEDPIDPGELRVLGPEGQPAALCPLRHTDVRANLAGFVGRITVRQEFENPYDRKIEAVYVFPLPQNAAVDEMVMTVGGRRVLGQIKPRDEARQVYEAARDAGRVASLLEQERPNIFTQSVANIEPGAKVEIEISYVEVLKYEAGQYEWVFPMVVGPRYIPGGGSAPAPLSTGTPTAQVPDADRITPPVARPGSRSGHDISVRVSLDGGRRTVGDDLIANTPRDIRSEPHEIDVQPMRCPGCVSVNLRNQAEIPNRDFILHFRLGDEAIRDALLTHEDQRGRWLALVLQPPERVLPSAIMPRELVFVLDTSGSMRGPPIELAQRLMNEMIGTMTPLDTFNVITFAGFTRVLWDRPRPATPENIAAAQRVVSSQHGSGGTEMKRAIEAALLQAPAPPGEPIPVDALRSLPADGRRVQVLLDDGRYRQSAADANRYELLCSDSGAIACTRFEVRGPAGLCKVGEPIVLSGAWESDRGAPLLRVNSARFARLPAEPYHEPLSPLALALYSNDEHEFTLRARACDLRPLMQDGAAPATVEALAGPAALFRIEIRNWTLPRGEFKPTSAAWAELRGRWADRSGTRVFIADSAVWPAAAAAEWPDDVDSVVARLRAPEDRVGGGGPGHLPLSEPLTIEGEFCTRIPAAVAATGATGPYLVSPGGGAAISVFNSTAVQKLHDGQRVRIAGRLARTESGWILQPERCEPSGDAAPIRIVCFMTDGYVGNDLEIIDAVRRHAATTRVFSFGVGNSVNRLLLEGMAHAGRGEVEFVTLGSDADGAVQRFRDRLRAPVLTDITIDWGGLPVSDVYPKRIPDLFSAKPVVVVGRLTGPPIGAVSLRGNTATGRFQRSVQFSWADAQDEQRALASLWARASVDELLNRDLAALQRNRFPDELRRRVTELGVQYGVMTPFTSFVAVEELNVTVGGKPVKVLVPVEMPQGVSYEGVFGEAGGRGVAQAKAGSLRRLQSLGYVAGAPAERGRSKSEQRFGFIGRAAVESDAGDEPPVVPATTPADKLAPILRNLAKRVELEGRDGNLGIDGVTVVAGRVDVMVELRDLTDATRSALKELGFIESGASRTVLLLIGSIDVRRLEELAALEAVVGVRPVAA